MRRNLIPAPLAIVLLATVLPFSVFSAEYPSRVDRVVLYPDMAEVTRVVEVDRPEAIVALPGLTPNLLPDTLSARVVSGAARITGVSVEDLFRTEPVDERVGELTRRIEELSDGKRRAEEAAAAGRREKELLERGVLAIYAPGEVAKDGEKGRPPRLSVAEVDAALSLYRARVEALDGNVFENDRRARELEKKIAAARQELDKIRNPRPTQEKVVRVDSPPPGSAASPSPTGSRRRGLFPSTTRGLGPGRGPFPWSSSRKAGSGQARTGRRRPSPSRPRGRDEPPSCPPFLPGSSISPSPRSRAR